MEKGSVDQDPADRRRDDPDKDHLRLIVHGAKHYIVHIWRLSSCGDRARATVDSPPEWNHVANGNCRRANAGAWIFLTFA